MSTWCQANRTKDKEYWQIELPTTNAVPLYRAANCNGVYFSDQHQRPPLTYTRQEQRQNQPSSWGRGNNLQDDVLWQELDGNSQDSLMLEGEPCPSGLLKKCCNGMSQVGSKRW
jgi:hypothetical protein